MLILDLWGISFHAVVVFCLGKDLLFKSVLGRCDNIVIEAANEVVKVETRGMKESIKLRNLKQL